MLGFALEVVKRAQYFAYGVTRAEQLVVELDLLLLIKTLQVIFKNAIRVGQHIQFHSYAQIFSLSIFNLIERRIASLLARRSCRVSIENVPDLVRKTIGSCDKAAIL